MSFSTEIKEELLALPVAWEPCCAQSLLYGALLFGESFALHDIRLRAELKAFVLLLHDLLHQCLLCQADVHPCRRKWEICLPAPEERARLLAHFGHDTQRIALRMQHENFSCEGCALHFLRGAFLACGTVGAPQGRYHLEFYVGSKVLATDLLALLQGLDFAAKLGTRGGAWHVYFKASSQIEELLGRMGAHISMLQLVSSKIEKDLRNNVNRVVNFEMANFDRHSIAAAEQLLAITRIRETGGFAALPPHLQAAATLREAMPEASLQELCDAAPQPLSRSGLHHRLQRLVQLAPPEFQTDRPKGS